MAGLLSGLIERPTVRYLIAFLLGASVGVTGGHAILSGMIHGFEQLFGLNSIHVPKVSG
jgi:hypothetical protein